MEAALATALSSPAEEPREGISAENFDEIIRQHQRRVYRVLFLLLKDADAADTLTQECFLRAYKKRGSFRGECRVETWLLRIAVNLARDHRKSHRVRFWKKLLGLDEENGEKAARQFPVSQPSAERLLLAREELEVVWTAVASLSRQQRSIFLLRFAEELSLAEIAQVLGISVGAVKTQLFRATGKVREAVKEKPCRS